MGGERWFGTDEDLEREKLAPEKPAQSSPQSSPIAGSNSARLALLDVLLAARNEVAEPPPYLANLHARMDAYVDRRVDKLADDIGPIEKIQAAYTALPYDYSGAFEIPMRTWRDFENPESWNLDVTESEPTRFRQGARLAAGYRFMHMTSNDRVVMERDGIGYVMDAALFSWFFGREFPELYREFEAYPRWAHEHPVLEVIGRVGLEMMSPENVIMSLPFMFAAPLFAELTALRGVAGAFAAESRMAGAVASAESRVAGAAASGEARAAGTAAGVVEGRVVGGVVTAEGRVSGAATAVEQRTAATRGQSLAAQHPRLSPVLEQLQAAEKGAAVEVTTRPRVLEVFVGPDLKSARQLAAEHPGHQVIAAEATHLPKAEDIARFRAEGGEFLSERFAESLPPGRSVEKIYVRYPLPHEKGIENLGGPDVGNEFQRLIAQGVPAKEALRQVEANVVGSVESMTNFGPRALEKLAANSTMEVIYWENSITQELAELTTHTYMDPATGARFRLEIAAGPQSVPKSIAPHSGWGIPKEVDTVTRVVMRKVSAP